MKFLVLVFWLLSIWPAYSAEQQSAFKQNSKEPIEINADSLEVFQDQQKAVFKGNVIADQGNMHIKSDVMTVYYAGKDQSGQSNSNKGNSIKKVDLNGNVFLSAPGESAKAKSGYFDTQKNFISLLGDVVLTKDKNVLKGSKLDYDLNSGYSKLTTDAATNGGRVKALFTPSEDKGDEAAQ